MQLAGIYIHIPFCPQKCAYCDFCSFPHLEHLHAPYVNSLVAELERRAAAWQPFCFDTLHIGGGTPTVLPPEHLARLSDVCDAHLALQPEAERTVEANPGTVNHDSLDVLRQAGFNRISLGVQSLHDDELALLGRIHNAEQAVDAFRQARQAGFDNINLDFIYGLSGQGLSRWRETLEQAVALAPEHLSLYALSIEEGTPLAGRIARGALPPPDDATAAAMYELAEALLDEAGYQHYEISNWARRTPDDAPGEIPRLASQHNLKYWRNESYLGLGVAATSYDGERRYTTIGDPAEYIRRLASGEPLVGESETLKREQRMDETMMLGLRLIPGVRREAFCRRFGVALESVYGDTITRLVEQGLLQSDARGVRLTPRGRLLGNRVFGAFLR